MNYSEGTAALREHPTKVVCLTADGGHEVGTGVLVAVTDRPTGVVRLPNGRNLSWLLEHIRETKKPITQAEIDKYHNTDFYIPQQEIDLSHPKTLLEEVAKQAITLIRMAQHGVPEEEADPAIKEFMRLLKGYTKGADE